MSGELMPKAQGDLACGSRNRSPLRVLKMKYLAAAMVTMLAMACTLGAVSARASTLPGGVSCYGDYCSGQRVPLRQAATGMPLRSPRLR